MLMTVVALLVAIVASSILTPVVRSIAQRRGLLDEPGERTVHEVAIPRIGGVAIAAAFYLGVAAGLAVALLGAATGLPTDHLLVILLGAALIAGVGMIDDLLGMRARIKFAAQLAIALVVAALGLTISRLDGPWGSIALGGWAIPLTVAWFVAVMNAINLIDGLDGLASGVTLTAMGAFFLIASADGATPPILLVLAAGAGGVIGFLRFNLYPATIIMGDTGSMLLGFLLAAAGISVTQSGPPGAPPWVPVVALGLALADTAWAILRRLIAGLPIFAPDKRHVHHQLLATGLSQRSVMLSLWLVSAGLGVVAVFLAS